MALIYLDHNATTPLLPEVWEAMRPFALDTFGNPASAHAAGRRARQALEDARDLVANLLEAQPDEVVFTSGATEANNLALLGLAGDLPATILASPLEHPSVLEPLKHLAQAGFELSWMKVAPVGQAIIPEIAAKPQLATLQRVNHETGACQPVPELAEALARANDEKPTLLHCDATQAVGRIPVSFRDLGVTSLAFSAHKFHGPKGIGALILKRGTKLKPRVWGGHQQQGRRPGTEPVHLVVGLARALEIACRDMVARLERIESLRERFLSGLRGLKVDFVLNGPMRGGVPHAMNLSIPGLRGDVLLMALDLAGVACSTGSACSSGSLLPSPVLQAMQVPADNLLSALRFSLGHSLTEDEIDQAVNRLAEVVRRLRQVTDVEIPGGSASLAGLIT